MNETMRVEVADRLRAALEAAGLGAAAGRVEPDPDDSDRQSLLIWYPKVTAADEGYIRPAVKIESGAEIGARPEPTRNRQTLCRRRARQLGSERA